MRQDLPSGFVTLLLTDIEGSTRLLRLLGADDYAEALGIHRDLLRAAFARHEGVEVDTQGDSFFVVFRTAPGALRAASESQIALAAHAWPREAVRVRMGVHSGEPTRTDEGYVGIAVNTAARIAASGHGGQILISEATAALVRPSLDAGVELVDLGEHRLKDLPQSQRIFQLRNSELQTRFPPLHTVEGRWSNLPTPLSGFVGRERELAEVRELLATHRLVTLTGSGGAGKTRLALELAADSWEEFPEGVRLVELAALTDPQLVADEVAERVGARAAPDTPLVETIAAKIGGLRMLLVLDNCEHMVAPVADIAERLLQTCAALKILATSRERLGIGGEASYRVPSLALPTAGSDPAEVRAYDSVRLLTERAAEVRPGFTIDSDNVEAVVSICRRLDGIPLALELAAARLRVLSPVQIASRLDERFRLLGGASRGSVERHRTLQATIDWSYEHLDLPQQKVFRRAGVFAGDFGLEAAEAVCAGDSVERFAVLDHLTALVDKSMVVPEHAGGGEMRYRLLESMREYAAARLGDCSESVEVAVRHAAHFGDHGEALQSIQRAGDLGAALTGLVRDQDNFRAALRFSLDQERFEDAARIVGAIGYLWYSAGAFREGIEWCRELFATEPELPEELLAASLHAYGTLLGSWRHADGGIEIVERVVALRRRLGDPARLAAALNNLGNLLNDVGRSEEAEVALRQAIEWFRAAGESANLPLTSLGYGALHDGDYEQTAAYNSEALAEAAAAKDDYGVALATTYLGECALHRGRLREARTRLDEAQAAFAKLGVKPGVGYIHLLLALVHRAGGQEVAAARELLAALENPDAHWYEAAKYWVLQVAASVVADRALAARLVGRAVHYYDGLHERQPASMIEDLARTQELLQRELGEEAFAAGCEAGRRLEPADAIASAERELRKRIELAGSTSGG